MSARPPGDPAPVELTGDALCEFRGYHITGAILLVCDDCGYRIPDDWEPLLKGETP